MSTSPRDPMTIAEWQEAADSSWAMLMLDSMRQYGLVVGGPKIRTERCRWILEQAALRGIVPNEKESERILAALC